MHKLEKKIVESIKSIQGSELGHTFQIVSWLHLRNVCDIIAFAGGFAIDKERLSKRLMDITMSVEPNGFDELFKQIDKDIDTVAKELGGNFSEARHQVVANLRDAFKMPDPAEEKARLAEEAKAAKAQEKADKKAAKEQEKADKKAAKDAAKDEKPAKAKKPAKGKKAVKDVDPELEADAEDWDADAEADDIENLDDGDATDAGVDPEFDADDSTL